MVYVAMSNRPIGGFGVETDFYWSYVNEAKEILKGNLLIDQYRGPVYQIVLAFFGFIFQNDFYSAGKFLNVLFASISLFFITKIIASIFDKKAALITMLFVSVNVYFIDYSFEAGTDMLFLVFYTSSLYYILKDKELNYKNFFIAGILSSLAYLTRYTGISLFILVIIIFIVTLYKKYKSDQTYTKADIIKPILSYFIPVIIMVSAWGIICYQKTGSFFYNMNYLNTAYAVYKPEEMHNEEWTEKYQNSFTSSYDVIFRDFGQFFYKIFIENFTSYFVKDLGMLVSLYIGILVAAGLIIFIIKFRSHNLQQKYFFIASFIFYVQILFTFYSERFSFPLLTFYYFLFVKIFYYDFLQKYNFSLGKLKLFTLIILTMIIIDFAYSYRDISKYINEVPTEILDIKKWNEINHKENFSGKTIMARKPHIAYYLDMNFEVIPFAESYDEFIDIVKKRNVDYIYIGEMEYKRMNENLRNILIDYKNPHKGLETIIFTPNKISILYKVNKN